MLSPTFCYVQISCSVLHMSAVSMFLLMLVPSACGILSISSFFLPSRFFPFPFLPSLTCSYPGSVPSSCIYYIWHLWWGSPSSGVKALPHSSSTTCMYFDFSLLQLFLSCCVLPLTMYNSLTLAFWTVVATVVVGLRLCIMLSCLSELYISETIQVISVDVSRFLTLIHLLYSHWFLSPSSIVFHRHLSYVVPKLTLL